MVKFSCTAKLPLPADVYFTERDTDAFRRLQGKILKLGDLEIRDAWREGETKHVVRLVTRPSVQRYLPLSLRRRLGLDEFAFEDCLDYRADLVMGPKYQIEFRTIPPLFQEKIHVEGRLIVEPVDAHTCRQTLEGEARIEVFGLRRIVEQAIVESLTKSYRQLPSVVRQWIVMRENALQNEGAEGLFRGRPSMEWLPNAEERERRCIEYRSPMKEAIEEEIRTMWGKKAGRRGTRDLDGEHHKTPFETDREEMTQGASDSTASSSLLDVSPPSTDQTTKLSDFESTLQFYDATDYASVDDTTSWKSAVSRLGESSEPSVQPNQTSGIMSSRRRLLHSCGFTQRNGTSCSEDEVIRRPAIRNVSPNLRAPSVAVGGMHVRRRNWMCCRFRSERSLHDDDVRCKCPCIYASKIC